MSIRSPVLNAHVLLIQREPVEFIMCIEEKKEKGKEGKMEKINNESVGERKKQSGRVNRKSEFASHKYVNMVAKSANGHINGGNFFFIRSNTGPKLSSSLRYCSFFVCICCTLNSRTPRIYMLMMVC